jgi:hypothetical protein
LENVLRGEFLCRVCEAALGMGLLEKWTLTRAIECKLFAGRESEMETPENIAFKEPLNL